MQILLGGGGRCFHGAPEALFWVVWLFMLLFYILPRRARCLSCIIPSSASGLFIFYVTGAVISENIPTYSTFTKIAIQIVAGIVVFTLLMILALKIFPYAPRSKDDDSNVTQDPTLLKYDDDD